MIRITVNETGQPSSSYLFAKESVLIGRSLRADIQLQSESVSRRHCRIELRDGTWRVSDAGSPNGVFVRRRGKSKVEQIVVDQIDDGDLLQIDRFTLLFEVTDAPAPDLSDDVEADAYDFDGSSARQMTQVTPLFNVRHALEDQPVHLQMPGANYPSQPEIRLSVKTPSGKGLDLDPLGGSTPALDRASSPAAATPPAAAVQPPTPRPAGSLPPLIPGRSVEDGQVKRERLAPSAPSMFPVHEGRFGVSITREGEDDAERLVFDGMVTVGYGLGCDLSLDTAARNKVIGLLWREGNEVYFRHQSWWPFPRVFVDDSWQKRPAMYSGARMRIGNTTLEIEFK